MKITHFMQKSTLKTFIPTISIHLLTYKYLCSFAYRLFSDLSIFNANKLKQIDFFFFLALG